MKPPRRTRAAKALLGSLLLHLLLLVLLRHWSPRRIEEALQPVLLDAFRPLEAPERFELAPSTSGARTQMQYLGSESGPRVLSHDAIVPIEVSPLALAIRPQPPPVLEKPHFFGEKSERFEATADTLPTLEELNLIAVALRRQELDQYERLWLPDADPGDELSYKRQRAGEVIEAAIEAMGGIEALNRVRTMALERGEWTHKTRLILAREFVAPRTGSCAPAAFSPKSSPWAPASRWGRGISCCGWNSCSGKIPTLFAGKHTMVRDSTRRPPARPW